MSALATDAHGLRRAFLTVESVRNGFGMLALCLNSSLRQVLVYEDWAHDVGVHHLWAMFGLSLEQLDLATELLFGPIWHRLIAMRGPVPEIYRNRLVDTLLRAIAPV